MQSKKPKIVVGMSGGVDSSLTAVLLKEEYEVIGVTLKLHGDVPDNTGRRSCGNALALKRARRSADEAGVELKIINCSERFQKETLTRCWKAFENGCTPNPCYLCNAHVKFVELIKAADSIGAEKIATGHYARIVRDDRNRPLLKRGMDKEKDQTYFLSALPAEILDRTFFPLGSIRKSMVRQLAGENGLTSVQLKESQDLCFTNPEEHFSACLFRKFSGTPVPGVFIDEQGQVLGKHEGVHLFTVGQRRGLGFATGRRMQITEIDPESGTIKVSSNKQAACSRFCKAAPFSWNTDSLNPGDAVEAQVRYRQHPSEAVILDASDNRLTLEFSSPVFGVTPGQVLVLYKHDCVIGSGVISR